MQFRQSAGGPVALYRLALGLMILAALAFAGLGTAQEEDDPAEYIGVMGEYLKLADHLVDMADRKETSIYFAIEGIIEIYEARGETARAIEHLHRILDRHGDSQTVRNLVRFKLRDLYNQTGQPDQAIEQLEKVIAENS